MPATILTPALYRAREVLLDVGLVRNVRGDLLEHDEVERESHLQKVLRSSVDMRPSPKEPGTLICFPICSIGLFRSGSKCCVMGCCFLAEALGGVFLISRRVLARSQPWRVWAPQHKKQKQNQDET